MLDVLRRRPAHQRHGRRRRAGVLLVSGRPDSCPREVSRGPLDLIVKAWTTPGPFLWNSKHYFFRYVNPWPRPLQQPHPAIWIPGVGSQETIRVRRAAALRLYGSAVLPYRRLPPDVAQFREACEKAGYTAKPEQMGWACRSTSLRPIARLARSSSRTFGTSSATS